MTLAEAVGCLASGLVLLTFGLRTMAPMRVVAIASNLAFIAYGLLLEAPPIWVLHSVLLPLNLWRLLELQGRTAGREHIRRRATTHPAGGRPPARPAAARAAALARSKPAGPSTPGGRPLFGAKPKKQDQELTLGSKVASLQDSGHTLRRPRTAGCRHDRHVEALP